MAFITLPNQSVGDPVTADYLNQVKDNFDDHEDRLIEVEQNISKVKVFNELFINSVQTVLNGIEEISIYRAETDFTLVEAKLVVLEAGTSGTTQIDVLKSSTISGSFTSIFSTKPSVLQTTGNNVESTNAVFQTTSVAAGDYLKLNIDSLQVGQKRILIHVYGEAV